MGTSNAETLWTTFYHSTDRNPLLWSSFHRCSFLVMSATSEVSTFGPINSDSVVVIRGREVYTLDPCSSCPVSYRVWYDNAADDRRP
jgi:hypothetical protein